MPPLSEERLQQYLDNFERQLFEVALYDSSDIVGFAAERLKLAPDHLRERMQQLGIVDPGLA